MYRHKNIFVALLFMSLLGITGCNNLFKDAPEDKLPENIIWGTPSLLDSYVSPWYRNMNSGFSIFLPTSGLIKGITRIYKPWFGDQIIISKDDWYVTAFGDVLKGNDQEIIRQGSMDWGSYYEKIQSVNVLLKNQDAITDGAQKTRVLGEAHFFRAYYYYKLLRQFGGAILKTEPFELENNQVLPRASYQEMVDFIAQEADDAASLLKDVDETETGRITKGAAYMLKAKAYLWCASPIFQNKEKNYLGFIGDESDAMLTKSRQAYDELFKLSYSLLPVTGTTQEAIKLSYRQIFLTKNSAESILEVQHSDDGDFSNGFGHKLDREAASPFFGGTTVAYSPTQNNVDEYGMQENTVYDPTHPYLNRDYRFYANILYDGSTFNSHVMEIHTTIEDGKEVLGADITPYSSSVSDAVTKTGYYLGKFVKETQRIDNDDTYASSQNFIIWRLAEAILDYAEIDFKQGRVADALAKVNQIRARVHMYPLTSLTWDELVNERRVELAFEETTYWDLFRWGIAEEKMNGSSNRWKGMKVTIEAGKDTLYEVININKRPSRVRQFDAKQYYQPIPLDEIRFNGIDQNPDWPSI
ncbi:MAG: RagB/SusD family nutrient uptake outer membrane protein [Bacteroidaceae bacterium]